MWFHPVLGRYHKSRQALEFEPLTLSDTLPEKWITDSHLCELCENWMLIIG
jgi:hypothetical protein